MPRWGRSSPARLVFVYGTLMRGEPNHRLLASADFVSAVHTEPCFALVDLGAFPAMLPGGDTAVAGEVYAVDGDTLAALDRLEGHPHFYRRTLVRLNDGACAEAYLLERDLTRDCRRIRSGDWRQHQTREDKRCGSGS